MHHRDINQYHLNVNTFSGSDHLPGFLLASSPNGTCVLSSMSLIKAGCIIYFNEFFCDGSFIKDAASLALKEEINFLEVGKCNQLTKLILFWSIHIFAKATNVESE